MLSLGGAFPPSGEGAKLDGGGPGPADPPLRCAARPPVLLQVRGVGWWNTQTLVTPAPRTHIRGRVC